MAKIKKSPGTHFHNISVRNDYKNKAADYIFDLSNDYTVVLSLIVFTS